MPSSPPMTDQAKLVEELRTYPWGVDDTPEGPRLLKRAADLLTSKDGELKASEIMRNLLSANLERRTEALVAAEALTLSLRAENERLRGALRTISNGTEDRAPPFRAIGPSQMAGIARAALSQSTGDTK